MTSSNLNGKCVLTIVSLIYVIAISATLPFYFILKIEKDGDGVRIDFDYKNLFKTGSSDTNSIVFWVTFFIFTTLLPTAILVTVYRVTSKALSSNSAQTNSSLHEKRKIIRNRKVNRMLIVAVVCFFLLITPVTLFNAIFQVTLKYAKPFYNPNSTWITRVDQICQAIATVNNCANPFVYSKMHKEYTMFKAKLCCKIKKRE